jgi:very-short-patch-repair endonuclease
MKNAVPPISSPTPAPLLPREKGLGDEGQSHLQNESQPPNAADQSQLTGKSRRIPEALLQRARELRQTQTPVEKILWECLRDRQLCDAKFRRQHNISQFIADFYCHAANIVIELDGGIHDTQVERDRNRDEWMQANHIIVLRFKNEKILDELETVLIAIAQYLSPSPQPSPEGRGSEDKPNPVPAPLLPREKGLGDEGQSPNVDE